MKRHTKKMTLLLLLSGFCFQAYAKTTFQTTATIEAAYNKIVTLHLDDAAILLNKEKKANPNNLMTDFLENYVDCIRVFISEDAALYKQAEIRMDARLKKIEAGDKTSPYYRFTQAMMRLHWLLAKSKFGESLSTIRDLKQALTLLEANKKAFPSFIGNEHGLGCLHVMVGAIPDDYNWGKNLIGISGSLTQGFNELEKVVNYAKTKPYLFEEEAILMTAYLQMQFANDKNEAWRTVSTTRINAKSSPAAAYVKALVALHTGRAEQTIAVLLASTPTARQYDIPQADFLLGTAKLYRLDKDADKYLLRFATTFKGKNQIKQAYQRLAEHALVVSDDEAAYKTYVSKGLSKGNATSDGDKQAQTAMTAATPDRNLLKADLLHSGGFYDRSLAVLNANNRYTGANKVQHAYLTARNYQDDGQTAKAIEAFRGVLDISEAKGTYFACSAALQLGLMYEKTKLKTNAKSYFQQCLDMDSDKYEASLHAKAKAGLARVK